MRGPLRRLLNGERPLRELAKKRAENIREELPLKKQLDPDPRKTDNVVGDSRESPTFNLPKIGAGEIPEGVTGNEERQLPYSVASPEDGVQTPAPLTRSYNFPGDRKYTFNALVEELALAERHCRDGSYQLCNCNPEKHLPLIAGLASEGVGFAESQPEKSFMRQVRDYARQMKASIEDGDFNAQMAEELRDWTRETRHRIAYEQWGEGFVDPDCPTCDLTAEVREKLSIWE